AAVPPALLALTYGAAVSFAAGGAVSATASSTHALALAKGVLQTMTATKLVHSIVLLLAVGVAVCGATLGAGMGRKAVPDTRDQATERGGNGGTTDPASHPTKQDLPARAAPAEDLTKVKGVQLILAATKQEYTRGEPVDLILTIENQGKKEFSDFQAKI